MLRKREAGKLKRWLIVFAKFVFRNLPFLRGMESSVRFRLYYSDIFGKLRFKGEFCQDMIAYLYLRNIKEGFYIDIGAYDGINLSNTYIFEQIGYRGICIEANPSVFKILKKYRKCDCYNVALSSESKENADFFKAASRVSVLSGLSVGMLEHKKQLAENAGKTEIIKVKTMTFDEIMANHPDIKHIDFMSLDVEGHEIPILETINFEKYTFGLITIEANDPEQLKDIMRKNGYRIFMRTGGDLMFIPQQSE